ncbi:ATP-binding cassette domain-containing protein [Heliorestis acidaminivorans]|uniref:ATP-binding cassette domain-containing protein n=1 Tax=Heliorestis acidaminivorans TaxID=553427 RepID=A0A6I0F3L4_9FIRM|nr:ATP-binding cassette domain-containing protein [Heliorestis acidaminivorans]KAB2954551.1 ATP-binding cassette domain-containing protein [Heliorestis acidaminivorans]
MTILHVEDIVKKYGDFQAVKGISFAVEKGEIFGFLGPNGAGKSTTIKILCTLLSLTSGKAVLNGFDVSKETLKVRQSIGLVFQDYSLDDRLTAEENLYFHGMLYNVPRELLRERMEQVLKMVDLIERKDDQVRKFSGGMKRRLEIARGLLHHPKVLFLDEPTIGLDPQTRRAIWNHVINLRDEFGLTVFMTTHYMEEAEHCDRIAIIDHGEIVALDSPVSLKAQVGGDIITVKTNQNEEIAKLIQERYNLESKLEGEFLRLEVQDGSSFVPQIVADFPGAILSIHVHEPTLDDVFLKLTGRAIRDELISEADRAKQKVRSFRKGKR